MLCYIAHAFLRYAICFKKKYLLLTLLYTVVIFCRKLNREKSFDEARTAVQSQIEKIFLKAASGPDSDPTPIHRSVFNLR
jgi:hypothetical protein